MNHIEALHAGLPGWTEISCIHPDPTHKPKMVSLWARCTDKRKMAEIALRAAKGNLQGYGLYIGITTRKGEKPSHERGKIGDAEHISALWVDMDGGDLDALMRFRPAASLILETGGGWHGYWLLNYAQFPTDVHRRTLRGLAKTLGADIKCAEFARVLRALGSYNTKPERNMARVLIRRWEPQWHYKIEEFAHLMEVEHSIVRSFDPPECTGEMPAWISEYLQAPPAPGQRNATLYRIAATLKDKGWQAIDVLARVAGFAGLDDEEVKQTVQSAYTKAARGSIVHSRDDVRRLARA